MCEIEFCPYLEHICLSLILYPLDLMLLSNDACYMSSALILLWLFSDVLCH
jgi:hypothetical protein